jgi:Tfp pilus assembly protein PilF
MRNREAMRNIALGAIVLICVGSLFATGAARADDKTFTLQTADQVLFGTEQVDRGRFEAGAARLETILELAGTSRQLRAPVLNDLCVAYTMLGNFAAAGQLCEENVRNGRDTGLALNNRGVFRIAAGDYAGAARDFAAAIEAGGAARVATANLQLAQARVAELRAEDEAERTARNTSVSNSGERDARAAAIDAATERFARQIELTTQRLAARPAEGLGS